MKTKKATIYIKLDVYAWLETVASREGRPISDIANDAVLSFIDAKGDSKSVEAEYREAAVECRNMVSSLYDSLTEVISYARQIYEASNAVISVRRNADKEIRDTLEAIRNEIRDTAFTQLSLSKNILQEIIQAKAYALSAGTLAVPQLYELLSGKRIPDDEWFSMRDQAMADITEYAKPLVDRDVERFNKKASHAD